jgi:hypothetical protein
MSPSTGPGFTALTVARSASSRAQVSVMLSRATLGAAIHRLGSKADARRDAANVDNATGAIVGQPFQKRLRDQNGAQDVDGVLPMEIGDGDLAEAVDATDAGIVDEDVELGWFLTGAGKGRKILGQFSGIILARTSRGDDMIRCFV